ncbi:transporter [Rhodoferax koreense]|uniref:Transporter n=1 Tax=Rhodoferax koreensis TaxID=1842727 RepID=A0A1P8JZB7_9BURK|nr:BON domain-containing protein [Rhodoferax koreense]APW39097.1 transporter [Rhodoferax koreense]
MPVVHLGALALTFVFLACAVQAETTPEQPANHFNDPFLQVTSAIADCPPEPGPLITLAQQQAEAHWRAERGTSCFRSGRCRLPNAYLYDAEIIPRVQKAILADGRFGDTSIWVEGQRRWVWLKGCVRRPEQAAALEQLVRGIDDVEAVINELKPRGP